MIYSNFFYTNNYQRNIDWRKPEKVDKLAEKYPYNSVPEAIQAVETYRKKKLFKIFDKTL